MVEANQVRDMQELVDYYREIFGILSQYALSQTSGQLVHREVVPVSELTEKLTEIKGRLQKKTGYEGTFSTNRTDLKVSADRVMLDYLLESLVCRGMEEGGDMQLIAMADGGFVRFELHRKCAAPSSDVLDGLFTPLNNRENMAYVICRQIIREHDEAFGHPGCRINAESEKDGMVIWFTVPMAGK